MSSATIKDAQGSNLVTLVSQRVELTQHFVLFIESTTQLNAYRALKPRTQYYSVSAMVNGQSLEKAFDLVPSDFTAPPIGDGTYDRFYRKAILINPSGHVKAGDSATLFVQLRT